jgi:hypothetical protein
VVDTTTCLVASGSFRAHWPQLSLVFGHRHPNEEVRRADHFEIILRPASGNRPRNHISNNLRY